MFKPLVLVCAIGVGATTGWKVGSPGGLMGSYLAGVLGASIGLYIGRRIQRSLGD